MDVSYIIPTYNRMWSLEKAVSSCRDSNLKSEIIVVDDGSVDNTAQWLKTQKDLVVISQTNQGKDWAVNKGFAIAKGKYIRFLDSDDWILPYSSDKLFEKAEAESLDVVCAGYQLFSENEKFIRESKWVICEDFLAQQLGECDSSHYSAYLFKKNFIEEIPHRQEYGARDDRQFIIEVAMKSPKVDFIREPTLGHRLHTLDKLQNADGLKESFYNLATLTIYQRCFRILEDEGRLTERRKKAAINILWPLAHWIAKTNIKQGLKVYKWILELDPTFVIPEPGVMGKLYKLVGFKRTEKFLRLRRVLKYGIN